MGDSAGELADHLHAQRPLEPGGQLGIFAFADLALESVGNSVCGETDRGEREKKPVHGPNFVEPQDAPMIARSLQHDAGPGVNSGGEECFLSVAGWEPRDVRRSDYVEPDLLELARQRDSRLRPSGGIECIVLRPSVNPARVFA